MEVWFSIQMPWKTSLKTNSSHGKLKFKGFPTEFCYVRRDYKIGIEGQEGHFSKNENLKHFPVKLLIFLKI